MVENCLRGSATPLALYFFVVLLILSSWLYDKFLSPRIINLLLGLDVAHPILGLSRQIVKHNFPKDWSQSLDFIWNAPVETQIVQCMSIDLLLIYKI